MSNYRLTSDAQSDLIEIRHHTLQQWGKKQSEKYLSDLRKTFQLLAASPSMGKTRPTVGENVLSFPYTSHIIYYVIHLQQLVIFAVLHKHMVPVNHLIGREV